MKQLMPSIALIALISATSCSDAPKADEAQATEAQEVAQQPTGATYKVDVTKSNIKWIGTKPTGRHDGTFPVKEGSIMVADNNITGGSFIIDAANLKVLDKGEGNPKLEGHLKSGDFFDVTKYPEAKFEITSVSAGVPADSTIVMKDATHMITGNLTMKEVTKSITFPAKIAMNDMGLTAHAEFNIDRTQWGIVYGNDKSLGDKFIRPEVNITVHLEATK